MIPAAFFLLGVGVTCIALVVVAWVAEARAESREMRRYSAMSAALSAVGTPRPNVEPLRAAALEASWRYDKAAIAAMDALVAFGPDSIENMNAQAECGFAHAALRHAIRALDRAQGKPYLPESRDADFAP